MARTYRPYVGNVKVKFTIEQTMKTQRGVFLFYSTLDRDGW
jgi:hypothetical protein